MYKAMRDNDPGYTCVTEELKSVAARYREQGKRIFVEIERSSELTGEIRKACTEIRDKITSRQKG